MIDQAEQVIGMLKAMNGPKKRQTLYEYACSVDRNIDLREPSHLLEIISNYLEENRK